MTAEAYCCSMSRGNHHCDCTPCGKCEREMNSQVRGEWWQQYNGRWSEMLGCTIGFTKGGIAREGKITEVESRERKLFFVVRSGPVPVTIPAEGTELLVAKLAVEKPAEWDDIRASLERCMRADPRDMAARNEWVVTVGAALVALFDETLYLKRRDSGDKVGIGKALAAQDVLIAELTKRIHRLESLWAERTWDGGTTSAAVLERLLKGHREIHEANKKGRALVNVEATARKAVEAFRKLGVPFSNSDVAPLIRDLEIALENKGPTDG